MNVLRGFLLLLCLNGFACAVRSTPVAVEVPPADAAVARLIVQVVGAKSDEGQIALALYDSAESFKKKTYAVAAEHLPLTNGAATWEVRDLPPGVYAVAVYHDVNANGELDRTPLGPPGEPYGFSNDARGSFGPPKFARASIELVPGEQTIEIELR